MTAIRRFPILRLHGPMQAWGSHTYEDRRPTELFPTRSGLVGLLGACLGIDRDDADGISALDGSLAYAARVDRRIVDDGQGRPELLSIRRITDYHTILGARRVSGKASDDPVQSWRDYLCDAQFTVAVDVLPGSRHSVDDLTGALRRPRYTPSLGRRSCPPAEPILVGTVEATDVHDALGQVDPQGGAVYSDVPRAGDAGSEFVTRLRVRDVPVVGAGRQFITRIVCFYPEESTDVSEQT